MHSRHGRWDRGPLPQKLTRESINKIASPRMLSPLTQHTGLVRILREDLKRVLNRYRVVR